MLNTWKHTSLSASVYLLFSCLCFVVACVTGSPSKGLGRPEKLSKPEAIDLVLNPSVDQEFVHQVRSSSVSRTYLKYQLRNEKQEVVDFKTLTVAKPMKDFVRQEVSVLEKDGPVNLHNLGIPNLGEKIEFQLDAQARVLKAGSYPKNSIFYVPSISLPKDKVKIGDTWTLSHQWVVEDNGLPIQVELVSILKNVYSCGPDECADIEISGEVKIPNEIFHGMYLESYIRGRILFNRVSGVIVWSEIRNDELLSSNDTEVKILSCLETKLVSPQFMIWPWSKDPGCEPLKEFENKVPGA